MEKRSDINKIIRRIGLFLFSAILILFVIDEFCNLPKFTYSYIGKGPRDLTNELFEGRMITQEVPYHVGDEGISFIFTNYGHRVIGDISIQAVGEASDFVYINKTLPGRDLKNNEYVDFLYPEGVPVESETIKVLFTSSSEPDHGLAILTTGEDSIPDLSLVIDSEKLETDLMVRRIVSHASAGFQWIMLGILFALGIPAGVILIWRKPPLETIYLLAALPLGILYMFIMSPLAIPDEYVHYMHSYNLSSLVLDGKMGEGEAQHFDFSGLSAHNNTRASYDRLVEELFQQSGMDKKISIDVYSTSYPLMYFPQMLGITLGRLFHLNFLQIFYLGRLCNLLFFIICTFYAVHVTSRFKTLLFLTGIMPMALHQAASYSYDTFINGLSILFIALMLKLIDGKERIRLIELLPAVIVCVLLCPAKPVYAPMVLLFLLIPIKRFGSFSKFVIVFIVFALLTASACLYSRKGSIMSLLSVPDKAVGNAIPETEFINVSGYYSSAFILSHPKQTAKIFLQTICKNESWFVWLRQAVGRQLAGLSITVDEWHIYIFLSLLLLASFSLSDQFVFETKDRVILLLICAGVVSAAMLVMFVGWTPYGDSSIQGIQGRYFIPIMALLFMCFNNRMIVLRKPIDKILIFLGCFINLSILNQVMITTLLLY